MSEIRVKIDFDDPFIKKTCHISINSQNWQLSFEEMQILKKLFQIFCFAIITPLGSVFAFRSAENFNVKITEISPISIGSDSEWFEFSVSSDAGIDLSEWKISNGKTTKKFSDHRSKLQFGTGVESLAGKTKILTGVDFSSGSGFVVDGYSGSGFSETFADDSLVFLPKSRAWFWWEPSPIAISDSGGILKILDADDKVLDEISYPKTKFSTKSGKKFSIEIWNRKADDLFPLIFREEDVKFPHSRGNKNFEIPTPANEVELLISEVSPKNQDADFIELFVKSAVSGVANLKYLKIKHNGSTIFFSESDFFVQEGDFIIVDFDEKPSEISSSGKIHRVSASGGISAGSGTVEVLIFSETSRETTEDFVCWKKSSLSSAESARVSKNVPQNWSGDCVEISEMIKNESIARKTSLPDSNTKNDFFRHFNGSWAMENFPQNSPPTSKIKIQGAKRIHKTSLNFSGEDSFDPDGDHDLKSFLWTINGKSCFGDGWRWKRGCDDSFLQNPDRIYFEKSGNYKICLRVEDFSEDFDEFCDTISVIDGKIDVFGLGGSPSSIFSRRMVENWLKVRVSQRLSKKKSEKKHVDESFFETFFESKNLSILSKKHDLTMKILNELCRAGNCKNEKTQKSRKFRKNLGLIFE